MYDRTLFAAISIAIMTSSQPLRADDPCPVDAPCEVEMGDYHLALPATYDDTPTPAVLFFHGWGSHGSNILKNVALRDAITSRGYMIIAPNGIRPGEGRNRSWAHQGSPSQARDELPFIDQVMEDVEARVSLDTDRVVVSGFSQGGSMAWHVACFEGERFQAYLPIAGAFWRPQPVECVNGPVRLLHVHGLVDTTVPIEGRPIGDRWHQGDIFESFATLRDTNQCTDRPGGFLISEELRCRRYQDCQSGKALELCLHDGGHTIPEDWFGVALDWVNSDRIER